METKGWRLQDNGAFRVPKHRDTWERVDAPKFGGEVYDVDGFKGANVETTDGKTFPVKTALAVPAGSAELDLGEAGPGQKRRAKQKEVLGDFARDLHGIIPSTGLTLKTVTSTLRSYRGAVDTMDVYGPARNGRYVSFLKLFQIFSKL